MKKLRMSLMLFLGVLASGSTMATGVLRVNVIPGEKEKALINVLDAPNNQLKVEVKDNNGEIVYIDSKRSPSYDYKTIYDFSKLDDGKYTLEVKLGDETEIDNLVVHDGIVQINNQEEQIAPHFALSGKFLEFSFPNTAETDVRLLVYNDKTDNCLFQERLGPEFNIKQALNLSKLNSGNYIAVVISGNDTYRYHFSLG